jgi:serine phosphatase RsbU (regulator of sigma subunit)/CHASE3 domain sensor protein
MNRSSSSHRRPHRSGANTAAVVLAFALGVSIVGSMVTFVNVRAAFSQHTAVDQAQDALQELYRTQLEEDTDFRGFLATGQQVYLGASGAASGAFAALWKKTSEASDRAQLQSGAVLLADLQHTHDLWKDEVEAPLIAHPTATDATQLESLGKAYSDQMEQDFESLTGMYAQAGTDATAVVQRLLVRAAASMAALILVFGLAAIIADVYRSRAQVELDRERDVADTLQRAFLSGWAAVPNAQVGTAYESSTRDAAVGGDLFDVSRIDEHRCVVLVADVSGKGLGAAVETAEIKYSVRMLAMDYDDPSAILTKFNRAFAQSAADPASFITAFVGILDDRDWTLRYASAGHAPAFVRRATGVEQLPVTGPVIGLLPDAAFSSSVVALDAGDTLVLATDGLTEARDSAGVPIEESGVMRWIASGDPDAQRLADELTDKVGRFAGGRINDDLAVLVLRIVGAKASVPSATPPAIEHAATRSR